MHILQVLLEVLNEYSLHLRDSSLIAMFCHYLFFNDLLVLCLTLNLTTENFMDALNKTCRINKARGCLSISSHFYSIRSYSETFNGELLSLLLNQMKKNFPEKLWRVKKELYFHFYGDRYFKQPKFW